MQSNLMAMIKNNPFITILLLFSIEVLLLFYLNYIELPAFHPAADKTLLILISFFAIPAIALLINTFLAAEPYKKNFQYLTIFLLFASVILYMAFSFVNALGKAYQH